MLAPGPAAVGAVLDAVVNVMQNAAVCCPYFGGMNAKCDGWPVFKLD